MVSFAAAMHAATLHFGFQAPRRSHQLKGAKALRSQTCSIEHALDRTIGTRETDREIPLGLTSRCLSFEPRELVTELSFDPADAKHLVVPRRADQVREFC